MSNDILKNQYLTVANVGRYLNISQSKAYELAHRKDFPVCRFGGSIRPPGGIPFLGRTAYLHPQRSHRLRYMPWQERDPTERAASGN